jgi:hypothetical protein
MNTTDTIEALSEVSVDAPATPGRRREVVALIPAHNEEESIAGTLAGLMTQSRRPDRVIVTVTAVTQVTKTSFPTSKVYGPTSRPELRLVTCGGTFDSATGHYLSNLIVYATEVKA